jgi:hypothetical protein
MRIDIAARRRERVDDRRIQNREMIGRVPAVANRDDFFAKTVDVPAQFGVVIEWILLGDLLDDALAHADFHGCRQDDLELVSPACGSAAGENEGIKYE